MKKFGLHKKMAIVIAYSMLIPNIMEAVTYNYGEEVEKAKVQSASFRIGDSLITQSSPDTIASICYFELAYKEGVKIAAHKLGVCYYNLGSHYDAFQWYFNPNRSLGKVTYFLL